MLEHLRSFHISNMPVELVAADRDELTQGRRAALGKRLPCAVEQVVLSDRLGLPAEWSLRGFWIKPLSLASSRFSEVMLMDVDVIFFRPPERLWHAPTYKQTGTHFFHDFLQARVRVSEGQAEG